MTTLYAWQTTAPHPWKRSHTHCADQGQVGWKLHAVPVERGDDCKTIGRRAAFCGTVPRHGWALDLFIDAECTRCRAAMAKREDTGETFRELADLLEEERRAHACEECGFDRRNLTQCPIEWLTCKHHTVTQKG